MAKRWLCTLVLLVSIASSSYLVGAEEEAEEVVDTTMVKVDGDHNLNSDEAHDTRNQPDDGASSAIETETDTNHEDEGDEADTQNKRWSFCGDNAWKRCVGNTRPCLCYDLPCRSRDTIEKRIVQEYNDIILERDYQRANMIFAEDYTSFIPAYQIHLSGREANVAYLALGDPDVSDSYEILNSTITHITQEELTVHATVAIRYRAVSNNYIFDAYSSWLVTFNSRRQMQSIMITIDSLALSSNLMSNLNLNITSLCTQIQTHCSGSNQQYASHAACATFLNSIPLSIPGTLASGNSVTCRSFHEVLSRSAPSIHCLHVGPTLIDPLTTPCM